jgi:hypothetical protein
MTKAKKQDLYHRGHRGAQRNATGEFIFGETEIRVDLTMCSSVSSLAKIFWRSQCLSAFENQQHV